MRLAAALLVLCSCAAQRATVSSPTLRLRTAPIASAKGDIRDIYKKVAPATVVVRSRHGYGTGVVIDARGFIVTNHHVIADAETTDWKRRVYVELGALNAKGYMEKQPQLYVAWVLKSDPAVDLAVLKLDAPPPGLPSIEVAKDDPVPGEPVAALGHGGIGLLWAIRDGEVMSIGKLATHMARLAAADTDCAGDPECIAGIASAEAERKRLASQVPAVVIQSSCQISPGDSGGPLVNRAGQLVGVNAFLQSDPEAPVSTNFHVHVSEVRAFLEQVPPEPAVAAPNPYELVKDLRPERMDSDGDGKDETTIYRSPLGDRAVVFAELEPGVTLSVTSLDGHTAAWLGDRLTVEGARGTGRGTSWQVTDGSPPRKVADDALLVDPSKLSTEAALRFSWVDSQALAAVGLVILQPLDQVPDPYASRAWELFDYDGDGKKDCGYSSAAIVIDPRQQLAAPVTKAPIAIMPMYTEGWYVVNGTAHGTLDYRSGAVTSGPATGQLATSLMTAGLSEHEARRVRLALKKLVKHQLTSGKPWPDPVADVGNDVRADDTGVEGLRRAAVSVVGDLNSALLFELDRDAVSGSAGEMERRARKGDGFDMAWVRRSETEWFLYDTDRDGAWDVLLFKPPGGTLEGFRRTRGEITRAPELDGGRPARARLFADGGQRTAFAALAAEYFNPEVIEP